MMYCFADRAAVKRAGLFLGRGLGARKSMLICLAVIAGQASFSFVGASSLVRQDSRLVETGTDSSDLTYGGTAGEYSTSGSCSYVTYYDLCSDAQGERVLKSNTAKTSYIVSSQKVTSCNRYRRESACNNCSFAGCTVSTSKSYGGTTVTYSVVSETGAIAVLPLSLDYAGSCQNVCTKDDELFITAEETCPNIKDWLVVNDDFDDKCANKQTCKEIEVKQGCEGSYMGSVAGKYEPIDLSNSDECQYLDDKSRSVYKRKDGSDTYLFYNGNQWRISGGGCSSIFPTSAFFEAGDEPYLDAEDRIQCYDGGYGSQKQYHYTDFSIRCTKQVKNAGSSKLNVVSNILIGVMAAVTSVSLIY